MHKKVVRGPIAFCKEELQPWKRLSGGEERMDPDEKSQAPLRAPPHE
jgi:hypothetical protein